MSNEPKAGPGLDPELLAAYVDQRLSPEQRAAVEAQLAADPDSHAVLVETMKALDELKVPEVPGVPLVPAARVPRVRWAMAGGLLAAAAAMVLVVWTQPELLRRLTGERVDPRFERLVAAVGEERYLEARLTGGFLHAPVRETTRAPQDSRQNLALLAAAGEIQKTVTSSPTPENLHAWGVAQLLLGQYDEAISTLAAIAGDSTNSAVLSDLAAAYVSRAVQENRPDDWPQALAAAGRAIDASSTPSREALFNRALAAEALNLRNVTQQYWSEYLAVETDPAWRAEAEEHLVRLRESRPQSWLSDKPAVLEAASRGDDELVTRGVSRHAQRIRETIEDELLPEWARQERNGSPLAAATLLVAARLAGALATRTTDDLLERSIDVVQSADRASRQRIAAAVIAFSEGRTLYERAAMQDSVAPFAAARQALTAEGVPLLEWCDLYLATAAYYRGDYPSSLATVERILNRASPTWLALAARSHWLQGLIATQRADYDRSLYYYSRTLQLFERLTESENQAAVHSLLATAFLYLGDEASVWLHTLRSLQAMTAETSFRRQHMILVGATNRATRLSLSEAALMFADEANAVNETWQDPVARIEIANYRARTLLQLGRADDARQEVASARATLADVRDAGLRRRAEAEVMQSEADVLAVADPRAGIDAATKAIEFFTQNRSTLRVPRLFATRASARKRLGDADGAIADLREGAARFDHDRQALPRSERLRLAYSDEVWDTYRDLVAAEVERGASCHEVLTAAERGRAATLATTGDAAVEVTAPTESNRSVISYSFVNDRLAIVALRAGRCELRLADFSASDARVLVAAFRTELARRQTTSLSDDAPARELFIQLIGPVRSAIDGVTHIDFVADGPLHYLPFAALRDDSGRYLIETVSIRMLPNLAPARSSTSNNSPRAALVSSGGAERSSNLPTLRGAKAEAASVAQQLRSADRAVTVADSAAGFLSGLHTADIVHFAGHAVVNEQFPLLSRLVLIGEGDQGWVTADQIVSAAPISPRLVFLSACSTQAGRLFGGEGPASVARAFLAAGAHEVVASLWPVADATVPRIVDSFYRQWLQTGDAAAAIRSAILSGIQTTTLEPQQWAAWTVVGRAVGAESGTSTTVNRE